MNIASVHADHTRAISMDIAPFQDDRFVPLHLMMESGETKVVLCSAESLLSLQTDLQRRLHVLPTQAGWIANDATDEYNDNAAGS